ncbi:reverse transcriptase family protein [Paraburkholderia tropica]|uniref:reverse transcriptase family protein n=1 Tax=Paraburkholderia tropica TaxID=92647 RepID=UPI00115FB11A|nr:reverse transcriptase family protein [Paraburkholderia tropica]
MNTPPLLVCFPSLDTASNALSERTRQAYGEEFRGLIERRLPPAVSIRIVATLFGFSPSFVGAMVRRPGRYYRVFEIRSGTKIRKIQAPRVALKVIQQWIGGHLAVAIPYRSSTFGFVPGRSHIDAAGQHCGAEWSYSIDIKDFFQSTSEEAVRRALMELGYSEHASHLVSSLCCVGGYLAQGAPSSPALSNLVFLNYDIQFEQYAAEHGLTYTRYADDIVFSGRGEIPASLPELAKRTIESGGWQIAPEKEKTQRRPYRLKVHGLLVEGISPRLTKGYRRRIRALRHLMEHGRVAADQLAKVAGHLNYAEQVASWARKSERSSEVDE